MGKRRIPPPATVVKSDVGSRKQPRRSGPIDAGLTLLDSALSRLDAPGTRPARGRLLSERGERDARGEAETRAGYAAGRPKSFGRSRPVRSM